MKNALIIITIVSEIYAVCVGDLNQNNVIDTLDIISLVNNIINNQIDRKLYKSYKQTYIKETGTPEKPVWDVFCDYLETVNA